MSTPKFKVGDLIRGNAQADESYSITTSRALMKVTRVSDYGQYIDVIVVKHDYHHYESHSAFFSLHAERFDLENQSEYRINAEFEKLRKRARAALKRAKARKEAVS